MKDNAELQKDVQDALTWEPLLRAAEIGVIAKDGIVTLTGTVNSYLKKVEAEHAAKNVGGVKAVVERIEVKVDNTDVKDDDDIAAEVINALEQKWETPDNKIKVKVEEGWVDLEGELAWHYQKEAAERSVNKLIGVRGVNNNIIIKSETSDEIEKQGLESALMRNASIDEHKIHVNVSGNTVTLKGIVESLYQREQSGRLAWNTPGVSKVYNELTVEYHN